MTGAERGLGAWAWRSRLASQSCRHSSPSGARLHGQLTLITSLPRTRPVRVLCASVAVQANNTGRKSTQQPSNTHMTHIRQANLYAPVITVSASYHKQPPVSSRRHHSLLASARDLDRAQAVPLKLALPLGKKVEADRRAPAQDDDDGGRVGGRRLAGRRERHVRQRGAQDGRLVHGRERDRARWLDEKGVVV